MNGDDIEKLLESLKQLNGDVDSTDEAFDGLSDSARELKKKEIARQKSISDAADRRKKLDEQRFAASVKRYRDLGNVAVSGANSLRTPEGAFNALGDATAFVTKTIGNFLGKIPILGGSLQGLSEAAGEAVKMVTSATGQAFGIFSQMSDSGVVTSFSDMRDAADKTGLLYADLNNVLSKHSQTLIAFGDTVSQGSDNLQKILEINLKSSEQTKSQFQKIGIGFAEFSEIQSSYVSQQVKAGFARNKSDEILAKEARNYGLQLDTLSKLTGISRKELQTEQEKLLTKTQFTARMRELNSMGEEGARIAANITQFLSILPPAVQEGMMAMIVSGGAITNDLAAKAAQALGVGGVDAIKLSQQLNEGTIGVEKAYQTLTRGMKKYATNDAITQLTTIRGAENQMTGLFVDASNLGLKAETNFAQARREFEEARAKQMAADDKPAKIWEQSYEMARAVEKAITGDNGIMTFNKKIASSLESLTGKLKQVTDSVSKFTMPKPGAPSAPIPTPRPAPPPPAPAPRPAPPPPTPRPSAPPPAPRPAPPAPAPRPAPPPAPRPPPPPPPPAPRPPPPAPAPSPSAPSGGRLDVPAVLLALNGAGITDKRAQANILAQIKAESNFIPQSEKLQKWTAKNLFDMYGGEAVSKTKSGRPLNAKGNIIRVSSLQEAQEIVARGPEAVGNLVYGGRMGNAADEGFKYRGRGLIQITGKDNYQTYGKLLKLPLVQNPDLANDPEVALKIAVAYFVKKQKKGVDLSDIEKIGAAVGYAGGKKETERRSQFATNFLSAIPAKNGALIQPKPGGTLVQAGEAGQAEAVVPLPDGRTIPVTITNSTNKVIVEHFRNLGKKSDQLIDLLKTRNSIESNLLRNIA